MAARTAWKGTLRVGLVSIPSKMFTATEASAKISFNQLHGTDGCLSRIQHKNWCPIHAKEVAATDIIKGYEVAPGKFVTFSPDELDSFDSEASSVLDITVVSSEPLDPRYIDSVSYLTPDLGKGDANKAAIRDFATISAALGDRLGIGTMVLRGVTAQVALQAKGTGFIVFRLRSGDAVRDFNSFASTLTGELNPTDLALATQLLNSMEGSFVYGSVRDERTERIKSAIDAKIAGTPITFAAPTAAPASFGFADALAKSLAAVALKPKAAPKALPVAPASLPVKAAKPAKVLVAKGKKAKKTA